jgi:hypothetical protein
MEHNPASELASAIQSAHIRRHPSPRHDINPSTASSKMMPATEDDIPPSPTSSISTIPSDVLNAPSSSTTPRPLPRRKSIPPLPDMRFEQSYLASISRAETNTQVALITIRDQVLMPLLQGVAWNLVQSLWRHWNQGARFRGTGVGAKVRRWWWGVNGWKMPGDLRAGGKRGEFVKEAENYYVGKFGSALGD